MQLLFDFFPILLFFGAYKLFDIYVATGVAILASVIQVGIHWYRHRRLENMHLVTLGLLVVFGGLTILLQDRTFIMWKPTILNWLFAGAFLGSQFIGEQPLVQRLMGHAVELPGHLWNRLNGAWSAFFLVLGGANLYVANHFFQAEARLREAVGAKDIDLNRCAELLQGNAQTLCVEAHRLEEIWVNFKLFGLLGLTILFIIAQAWFLTRYMKDPDQPGTEET